MSPVFLLNGIIAHPKIKQQVKEKKNDMKYKINI